MKESTTVTANSRRRSMRSGLLVATIATLAVLSAGNGARAAGDDAHQTFVAPFASGIADPASDSSSVTGATSGEATSDADSGRLTTHAHASTDLLGLNSQSTRAWIRFSTNVTKSGEYRLAADLTGVGVDVSAFAGPGGQNAKATTTVSFSSKWCGVGCQTNGQGDLSWGGPDSFIVGECAIAGGHSDDRSCSKHISDDIQLHNTLLVDSPGRVDVEIEISSIAALNGFGSMDVDGLIQATLSHVTLDLVN